MKLDRFKWESDALVNFFFQPLPLSRNEELYKTVGQQLLDMHRAHGQEGSVKFHKKRLGRQSFTWSGGSQQRRFWVWDGADWRVFANNVQGTSFEVRCGLTLEQAVAAFHDYLSRVGLLSDV